MSDQELRDINFEEIYDKTLKYTIERIKYSKKLNMSELKIINLIFEQGGNGIYLFFQNNDCVYVGSSCGRPFVDRIPAHFDAREFEYLGGKWGFSNVIHRIVEITNCSRYEAANELLNYNLLLINIQKQENRKFCKKLEKILICELQPKFNRHYRIINTIIDQNVSLKVNLDKIN